MKNPDRLCIVDSAYTLFLYLVYSKGNVANTLFITADGIPEKILAKLPHHIQFPTFRNYKFSIVLRLLYCFYFALTQRSKMKRYSKLKVFGQDHLFFSFLFMKRGFILLEDGLGNYIHSSKRKASFIRKLLLGGDEWGYSTKVESVILSGMAPIPEKLKNKVTVINIKKSWNEIDQSSQQTVMAVFDIAKTIDLNQIDILIMTQPFSEDNVISEKEKIDIYKKIMSNYDGVIVIKPHPRETTNYINHLSVPVLDGTIPVQLMLFFTRPKKIVTCFSSIPTNDYDIPVDIYGTCMSEKLKAKYGIFESNINAC